MFENRIHFVRFALALMCLVLCSRRIFLFHFRVHSLGTHLVPQSQQTVPYVIQAIWTLNFEDLAQLETLHVSHGVDHLC